MKFHLAVGALAALTAASGELLANRDAAEELIELEKEIMRNDPLQGLQLGENGESVSRATTSDGGDDTKARRSPSGRLLNEYAEAMAQVSAVNAGPVTSSKTSKSEQPSAGGGAAAHRAERHHHTVEEQMSEDQHQHTLEVRAERHHHTVAEQASADRKRRDRDGKATAHRHHGNTHSKASHSKASHPSLDEGSMHYHDGSKSSKVESEKESSKSSKSSSKSEKSHQHPHTLEDYYLSMEHHYSNKSSKSYKSKSTKETKESKSTKETDSSNDFSMWVRPPRYSKSEDFSYRYSKVYKSSKSSKFVKYTKVHHHHLHSDDMSVPATEDHHHYQHVHDSAESTELTASTDHSASSHSASAQSLSAQSASSHSEDHKDTAAEAEIIDAFVNGNGEEEKGSAAEDRTISDEDQARLEADIIKVMTAANPTPIRTTNVARTPDVSPSSRTGTAGTANNKYNEAGQFTQDEQYGKQGLDGVNVGGDDDREAAAEGTKARANATEGLNVAIVAGGAACGVGVMLALLMAAYKITKRRRRGKTGKDTDSGVSPVLCDLA